VQTLTYCAVDEAGSHQPLKLHHHPAVRTVLPPLPGRATNRQLGSFFDAAGCQTLDSGAFSATSWTNFYAAP